MQDTLIDFMQNISGYDYCIIFKELYHILLIICSENLSRFFGLLRNHSFLANFCTWILWKLVRADNRGRFLGMKVKTWNSESFSPQIISNTVGCLFSKATNFVDFGDVQEICFTKNKQKFYHDTDCRLKRKHQCRFVKMVSSDFPFTKFVALKKGTLWFMVCHCIILHILLVLRWDLCGDYVFCKVLLTAENSVAFLPGYQ